MRLRLLFVICSLAILSSCATSSTASHHLDIGTTKQKVPQKAKKPFSKTCSRDQDEDVIEIMFKTTWDAED